MNDSPNEPFDDSEAGLQEALAMLAEVMEASYDDSTLQRFATLTCQLLQLRQELGSDGPDNQLLQQSLAAIAAYIDGGGEQHPSFDTLTEQATDQWAFAIDDVPEEDLQEGDFSTPSAEQVSQLLSQFAGGQHSDHSNRGKQDSVESEAANVEAQCERHASDTLDETAADPLQHLDDELREAYLDDANSCLAAIEQALLQLADSPDSPDPISAVLRELHTLKGASGSVGLTAVADQIHGLEEKLRVNSERSEAADVDALLHEIDSLRAQITGDSASQDDETRRFDAANASPQPKGQEQTPDSNSETSNRGTTSPTSQGHASAPKPSTSGVPTSSGSARPASPAGSSASAGSSSAGAESRDEYVRVRESQLTRLMDMLAELVMLRNRRETEVQQLQAIYQELIGSVSRMRQLSHCQATAPQESGSLRLTEVASDVREIAQSVRHCVQPVAEGNAAVSQFIRQFRKELIELRRTPISGLLGRLQRSVREAASGEGKRVDLRLFGEDATIERSMQQRLYEPLLHIVRNSVCHGIETPDERVAKGKPERGTISIEATSGADLLTITIRDDGAGLNYEAIRRRGLERGLISEHHAVSEQELAQLIFHPGFSTRSSADQLSGRGVGMDVVASTLQRMRGWLEIESQSGSGTTIRLCCPVPSLVQHAMVFRCSGQLFALPMQSIHQAGGDEAAGRELNFAALLPSTPQLNDPERVKTKPRITLASTAGQADRIAIIVDEIVGPEEVVVRPLPTLLRSHPYCSGATLSGLGKTVLLLDARRLIQSQGSQLQTAAKPEAAQATCGPASRPGRPRILVADDSLSARKRVVRSLQRYELEITEVHDGREALQRLKRERFDAVFSDLEMPHVTGLDLLKELQENESEDLPPVVLITSRDEPSFVKRALEFGVAAYLNKPVEDEQIDQTIASIAALSHLAAVSAIPNGGNAIPVQGDIQ